MMLEEKDLKIGEWYIDYEKDPFTIEEICVTDNGDNRYYCNYNREAFDGWYYYEDLESNLIKIGPICNSKLWRLLND